MGDGHLPEGNVAVLVNAPTRASRTCRSHARSLGMSYPRVRSRLLSLAHAPRMCDREEVARMIQVRNVSPELHAELVRRARLAGKTLTAYVQDILEREVGRPPAEEVFARIKARTRGSAGRRPRRRSSR